MPGMIKAIATFSAFDQLDVRVGTILSAERAETKKPTYRMRIDFGADIGVKTSCGSYTNYRESDLIGRQVVAVVNFGPKKMGPELSEVLVLGVSAPNGDGTIFLTTEREVPNGLQIF
jgi:tRNA-binding protein